MKFRILSLVVLMTLLTSVVSLAAQDSGSTFPVTIEHKYGSTTITEPPQRIVSLGFTEQDPMFALGVQPVAIRYWYGDENNAVFPWAEEAANGAQPEVLNMPYGALNYEAILALEPDLISDVDSGITEDEYANLSQIAPTLAQYGDYVDFGMPWQETTRLIGMALGKSDEAETVVAALESRLETVREENPEFQGKSTIVAYNTGSGYGFYTGQDSRGRFFTDLGFVIPDDLNEIAGESFYAQVSNERVDLLDRDLIVFLALQFHEEGSEVARAEIESDPLLSHLGAVQDGRVLYVSDEFDNALQFSTVLSLNFLLDGLVPEIADVLGSSMDMVCDGGFRGVANAVGEVVCVPENPQRIVALSEVDVDALLALGVEPIAVTNGRGQAAPPRFLVEHLSNDVVSTGTFFQPNLEIILEQEPDLILFGGFGDPDVLAQLNAIAPVYNAATFAEPWQVHLVRTGEALNMQADAEALIADYDSRISSLRDSVGASAGGEFVVARWAAEGPQIMAPGTISSNILMEIGLTSPSEIPELEEGHRHTPPLSLETLDLIDVDWAFVGTLQAVGDAVDALDEALDSPLFQALDIVQNERLIVVDGSIWTSVGGYIGAMTILDDIEAAMLEEG